MVCPDLRDSLVADLGLAQYLVPLKNLSPNELIGRFMQLENDADRLRPYIKAELDKYRRELDAQYAILLTQSGAAERAVTPLR